MASQDYATLLRQWADVQTPGGDLQGVLRDAAREIQRLRGELQREQSEHCFAETEIDRLRQVVRNQHAEAEQDLSNLSQVMEQNRLLRADLHAAGDGDTWESAAKRLEAELAETQATLDSVLARDEQSAYRDVVRLRKELEERTRERDEARLILADVVKAYDADVELWAYLPATLIERAKAAIAQAETGEAT